MIDSAEEYDNNGDVFADKNKNISNDKNSFNNNEDIQKMKTII